MSYRPDFSQYLAHFTNNRGPAADVDAENPAFDFAEMTAMERLVSILDLGRIFSTDVRWIGRRAVCFTECPWASIIDHADRYSPYGIGFDKARVFAARGSPVYYVRADHWGRKEWVPHLKTFVTPFWPAYHPEKLRGEEHLGGATVDYPHEREWGNPARLHV